MERESRLHIATLAVSFLAPLPAALAMLATPYKSAASFYTYLFGVPLTFIAVLVLGWPLYSLASNRGLYAPSQAALAGALCALPFTLALLFFFESTATTNLLLALAATSGGVLGGILIQHIALRPNNSFKADGVPPRP